MKRKEKTYLCCEYGELSEDGKMKCMSFDNRNKDCECWKKGMMTNKMCSVEQANHAYNARVRKNLKTSEIVSVKSDSFAIRENGIKLYFYDPRIDATQRDTDIHIVWDKSSSFQCDGFLGSSVKEGKLTTVSQACDWFMHCLDELETDFQQKIKAIKSLKKRMAKGMLENHVQMTDKEKEKMMKVLETGTGDIPIDYD